MKSVKENHLSRQVLALLSLDSDEVLNELHQCFTREEAYHDTMLHAMISQKKSLVPEMFHYWPDHDGACIGKSLKHSLINDSGSTSLTCQLAKMFIERNVPLSRVLMENENQPLLFIALDCENWIGISPKSSSDEEQKSMFMIRRVRHHSSSCQGVTSRIMICTNSLICLYLVVQIYMLLTCEVAVYVREPQLAAMQGCWGIQ